MILSYCRGEEKGTTRGTTGRQKSQPGGVGRGGRGCHAVGNPSISVMLEHFLRGR